MGIRVTKRSPDAHAAPERYLAVSQVAALLQVSERTIRRRIDEGRLQAIDIGHGNRRQLRVNRSNLDDLSVEARPNAHRRLRRSGSRRGASRRFGELARE